jgi:zinc transporter ZupT
MAGEPLVTVAAALVLGATHVLASHLRFLRYVPRSGFLSAAGGISVAYVFAHLLPDLAAAQEAVSEDAEGLLPFAEDHAYLVALAGLSLFYGVERASTSSRRTRHEPAGEDATSPAVFWFSTATFALYNGMIGYLLVHGEQESWNELALFVVALGLHFVINDSGLREHHKRAYSDVGRWVLAGAVLCGWLVGQATEISEQALGLLLAFIAGGVILNVLKEEVPGDREARFMPFAVGALAYAILLQAL